MFPVRNKIKIFFLNIWVVEQKWLSFEAGWYFSTDNHTDPIP